MAVDGRRLPQICGLTAEGDGKYTMVAVATMCKWLTTVGNPLRSLKLGQNQLCAPKPKVHLSAHDRHH